MDDFYVADDFGFFGSRFKFYHLGPVGGDGFTEDCFYRLGREDTAGTHKFEKLSGFGLRIKRIYRPTDAMTPLDKLASLPTAQKCLREGVALAELQIQASAITDLQAATNLNAARQVLFKRLKVRVA